MVVVLHCIFCHVFTKMMHILHKIIATFKLSPDYTKRIFGLDLMRALAIVFVVMGHGSMLEKAHTNFPWIRLIDGVELFFVLSGFLIGGILIRVFEQSETLDLKLIGKFWLRRWFRTLPNYYLILIINVLVVYFGVINEDITQFNWRFFFFLQNFSHSFSGFFWESWSVSIEEWFYLLFPLILAFVYRVFKRSNVTKKVVFLCATLLFLIIPFVLRYLQASTFEVDAYFLGVKIFKVVIYRLDGIAFGLLAAAIKYWYPKFWLRSRNVSFLAGIIISYTLLYTTWLPNDFSTKVFKLLYQSVGCMLLLPKFDSMKHAPVPITRIVTHISLISYSMYLINLALVSEVIRDNFSPQGPFAAWVLYLVYWILVLVFSTYLYKYYEKPMMNMRDRLAKEHVDQ